MKKFMICGIFLVISALPLFGCSHDKENEAEPPNQVEERNENTEKSDEPTNDEEETDDTETDIDILIEEVTKINKELESFSIESIIDTTQTFDGEKNHSISTQHQDTIFDPFQFKKYMVTEQKDDSDYDQGGWDDEEITIYNVEGVNYVNFKGSFGDGQKWVKSENKYSDDEMRDVESLNVRNILENLSELTNDRTLTEEDGVYILSLDIDVDQLAELDKENPQFSQSDDEETIQKLKDTYKVEQMDYQMKIDKESKYLLEIESTRKFSYEMDFNDQTGMMETLEKTVVVYKDHNQVDEIVLPEEVLDHAIEVTE